MSSTTINKVVFDSYIKFSERDKVHLFTYDNKQEAMKNLLPVARQLRLDIVDYTQGDPEIIYVSTNAALTPLE